MDAQSRNPVLQIHIHLETLNSELLERQDLNRKKRYSHLGSFEPPEILPLIA